MKLFDERKDFGGQRNNFPGMAELFMIPHQEEAPLLSREQPFLRLDLNANENPLFKFLFYPNTIGWY